MSGSRVGAPVPFYPSLPLWGRSRRRRGMRACRQSAQHGVMPCLHQSLIRRLRLRMFSHRENSARRFASRTALPQGKPKIALSVSQRAIQASLGEGGGPRKRWKESCSLQNSLSRLSATAPSPREPRITAADEHEPVGATAESPAPYRSIFASLVQREVSAKPTEGLLQRKKIERARNNPSGAHAPAPLAQGSRITHLPCRDRRPRRLAPVHKQLFYLPR